MCFIKRDRKGLLHEKGVSALFAWDFPAGLQARLSRDAFYKRLS